MHHPYTAPKTSLLLLLAGLLTAPGCGDDDNKNESADPGVEVPEITGDVSSDDFCALYDQISCAGALGCCDGSDYADAADCEAGSTCSSDLASVLASESVSSGVVSYDAAAAGDYLRGLASSTSSCDPAKDTSSWIWAVFTGTLAEGADCSTSDDDLAGPLRCAAGLACHVTVDDEAGTETAACVTAPESSGGNGDSCVDDEGCNAGSCVDNACSLSTEDVYCPESEDTGAPSNASTVSTSDTPEGLRVTANSNTNAGTTNDITLCYRNQVATYCCDITATIADGGSQECVTAISSLTTSSSYDVFYVKYTGSDDTDGLRVTELAVKRLTLWDTMGTMANHWDAYLECTGCSTGGVSCNSCWIDSDAHGKCTEMKVQRDDNRAAFCVSR